MTATLNNTDMIDDDDVEASEEELNLVRKLRKKAAMQEIEPYRRQLLLRLKKVRPKEGELKDPNFAYRTYLLQAGTHSHHKNEDKRKAEAETAAGRKANPEFRIVDADVTEFIPGQRITPQSDNEALMLDQDKNKFRAIDAKNTTDQADLAQVEALLAQIEALKSGGAAKQAELDAREKAVNAKEEELKKKAGK